MSVCVLPASEKQYRTIFLQQVCFCWFSCWHFYPQLSSTCTFWEFLVPFAAFSQTLLLRNAAHFSFYVGAKLIWDEFSPLAGSFTTVGGSQVELCMIKSRASCTWLLYVQRLHSEGSAGSRHPPTCLPHSRLSDVTRTLVVLSVLTQLCIHVTVCFF